MSNLPDEIEILVWNYMSWQPVEGWEMWLGVQGDFVDHVHVQFDLAALGVHYDFPVVLEPEV